MSCNINYGFMTGNKGIIEVLLLLLLVVVVVAVVAAVLVIVYASNMMSLFGA